MAAAPDLCRPIGRAVIGIEGRRDAHDHRRADRLEPKLVVAPPAHPHRPPGPAHRDHRRVGRGVVGAIVAIAARPLDMLHRDRRRVEREGAGECRAQRVDPLRMRPYREPPVAVEGEAAGRRHRGVRDVHPGIGCVLPGAGRRQRRPARPVDRRLLQQPARLLLERGDRLDAVPDDTV